MREGYQSRVEQLLNGDDELTITITHAGKNQEGGGNYIAYTIRTGVSQHNIYMTV